jgi:RHS repeat-associated protein
VVRWDDTAGETITVTHFTYDTFGNVTSGDTTQTRYLYTGRDWDADVGLQYNRARWYDPATGRWVSDDPIGFNAGDANLARYVGNGVTYYVDPSGLWGEHAEGILEAGVMGGITGLATTGYYLTYPLRWLGVDLSEQDKALAKAWNYIGLEDSGTQRATYCAGGVAAVGFYGAAGLEIWTAAGFTQLGVVPLSQVIAQPKLEFLWFSATGSPFAYGLYNRGGGAPLAGGLLPRGPANTGPSNCPTPLPKSRPVAGPPTITGRRPSIDAPRGNVPTKATDTLDHVRKTGQAPSGYQGGRTFGNDGRGGGQVLSKTDANGNPITYWEFDVNPYQRGVNRGAERLVVGSDGRAYFTSDHYQTFTEILP